MKLRTKLLFWLTTIVCIVFIFMTSSTFPSIPIEGDGSITQFNVDDWSEYILKIGISVMLLIIAFFSSSWYNSMQKSNKEVTNAVSQLVLQTKLLQQTNKQIQTDVSIISKRQNRLIDWKNKHNLIHASCAMCPNTK